ncbi:hypothetical protein ERJ75_001434100 [Trypanosoma vivax]|uniref:Uncharacterized protein n=1 Tax=Trypanosoma vivax (strain Y486) TaxID=1055687 RepID=G0TTJ0_TRYVY|nr:hypothetical protein TRVL_07946 [Trypanosoma vivax]KAH8607160.1 hypothetical protein ERJ75_001434100 [Trypanosoma vivax]CCC47271.1 conserved hypothetical protein [Trypanosoma vivax Y486]
MSFQSISLDCDGPLTSGATQQTNGDEGQGGMTDKESDFTFAGVPVVHPMMPAGKCIRCCKERYHFELSWQVPFPQIPAVPLLYLPQVATELLSDPSPLGVMQSELDAMSVGVLDRIPLAYHLLLPDMVSEARQLSMEHEKHVEEVQQQNARMGLPEKLTWRPVELNPSLDPADADLLDTDIDLNLVLERDKPSLTLLQRPLYTDMGLVPHEQRHLERLARIVPDTLRHQMSISLSQDSQRPSGTPELLEGLTFSSSQGDENLQTSVNDLQPSARALQQWKDDVFKSFRVARAIDTHYDELLRALARGKLGLDETNPAAMQLARRIWRLLLDGTKVEQQRDMWRQLCLFSSNYNGREELAEHLQNAVATLQLPNPTAWADAIHDYIKLLEAHISSAVGGVEGRRKQLQISEKELEPSSQCGFEPQILLGSTLRQTGREFGPSRQLMPIYPVEVMPLYPAGFSGVREKNADAAATRREAPNLGEMEVLLHHVVLPGAVVSDVSKSTGPHILVNNSNLLVADSGSESKLSDGLTVGYEALRENTFEALGSDTENTSSYLLQVSQAECDSGSRPSGFANADGRYVVYRRLGVRDLFIKAPNAETPPYGHYVVVFDGPDNAPRESRKRQRGASEEPQPNAGPENVAVSR